MDNSLKRREHVQQQQQQQQQPCPLPPDSDEENMGSSGDPLVSPCKRLRLHDDSPGKAVTFADQTNVPHAAVVDISLDHDVLYSTPEKPRLDGTAAFHHEDFTNPYNSTLEKSEQPADLTEEDPSVLSSLGQPDLAIDQSHDKHSLYCQSEPPQDEVLLCTPVKELTFHVEGEEEEEDNEDSMSYTSPQQTMPNNTPERSIILGDDDDDDSDAEEIFINTTTPEQLSCPFPEVGTSITFADRTNLDGVRREVDVDTGNCVQEEPATFADKTNIDGAKRIPGIPDLPEGQQMTHDERRTQTLPRSRLSSHLDPLPCSASEPYRTQPTHDGLPSHPAHHHQRHRFASAGNLCAEELDHHRLSLQSYGSLAHFERQQYGLTTGQQPPAFVRPASHRASVAPPHNFPLAGGSQERLVDYGSIDGLRNVGLNPGGAVNPSTMVYGGVDYGRVDYGRVEGPVPAATGVGGHSVPGRQGVDGRSEDGGCGKLWFYGSVDQPQRVTHTVQSLHPPGQQSGHLLHGQQSATQGNLPQQGNVVNRASDQPFVRSANRRTLPRLGGERNQEQFGHHDTGHHYTGHHGAAAELPTRSRPQLGQIQKTRETSSAAVQSGQWDSHPGTSKKSSRGTMCAMSDPGHPGSEGRQAGGRQSSDPGLVVRPHPHPHVLSSRASGSSGSHAEVQCHALGSSASNPDSLPRSERHPYLLSGAPPHQGSWNKPGGRSVGSQGSHRSGGGLSVGSQGSHRSGGSQGSQERSGGDSRGHSAETLRLGKGFSAADLARAESSKKRRILETPGQVRVSAYLNCGLVTVHVKEGRYFKCNWKAVCDSYIKLSLIPEESGRKLRLKSKPVHNTNYPVFDEKFSLELQKSDENKRLLISMWHKDLQSGFSEFMGCTSFGVRGIQKHKVIDSWFHLLTEEVGKKKHLQVANDPQASRPLVRPRNSTHSIPQINRDVYGLESFTIHIERGKNGFGFSVVSEIPVHVGRVDLGSPADKAGLKVGDIIIKVNNQNVSRSTMTSVAKLVKKSGQNVVLNITRPFTTKVGPPQAAPPQPPPVTAPYEKSDSSLWQRPDHIYESISDYLRDRSGFGDDHDKENTKLDITSVSKAFTRDVISASTPLVPTSVANKLGVEEGKKLESIHRLLSLELDFIDFMLLGIQRYSRPLRHCIFSATQHSAVFQNIETLVTISQYHVQQIQENAPSLYPESDDDSQSSDDRHFASAVAMIYYSKAHLFCQAHEAYAAGLSQANCVLSEMRQNEKFLRFIKDPPLKPGQPSISAFIFRPLQHIKELWSVFQEIYMHTPNTSIDHATLKEVTHVLQASVLTISSMSNARVQSVTSLSSHTKSSGSGKGSSVSSAASSKVDSGSDSGQCAPSNRDSVRRSASLQTVRVMDREVMDMQDRLVFSQNIPVFQLCQEDRHIIYQDNVFFLHNDHWSKIQMTLLSDIVVLCRPETDGSLHVLCDPICLSDICHIHTSTKHTTELVLTLQRASSAPSSSRPPSTQRLVLRTPSPDHLATWCNLLGQRCTRAMQQQQQQLQQQQLQQQQLQQQQQHQLQRQQEVEDCEDLTPDLSQPSSHSDSSM